MAETFRPKVHYDFEDNEVRQGPFRMVHNATTGDWELRVVVGGQNILFAVFETDVNGDVKRFKLKGSFEEVTSL